MWDVILWIIAAILAVWGIIELFNRRFLLGIILLVVACLVGPGGVSLFT